MLMNKWSSKPADYNANRVRNNQRRHRARVKSRIEELEARLEETNAKLETAQSTITSLKAEVDTLRAAQSSTSPRLRSSRSLAPPASPESAPQIPDLDPQFLSTISKLPKQTSEHREALSLLPDATTQVSGLNSPALGMTVENDSICDCPAGAPPPALGESTIACSSAFQIIEQQNFSGVEVTTIKAWLGPGFRLKPGEACRVETNRLYELLDHITSPS